MGLTSREEEILKSIVVASENDPNNPEFPSENPKFPATPTYKIEVPGFSNVWFKDESYNKYGSHKDRMAWEIVVTYRDFLIAKKIGQITKLPKMSIITSGSAGFAIQNELKKYNLPNLKCLIDFTLDPKVKKVLKSIGCELYETDLSRRELSWKEILSLTNNDGGVDITSSEALDPTTRFYDWLSYEILNSSPEYCFLPFGTGNLYENVLNINKKEVSSKTHDPRFSGDVSILRGCHFLGATTNNPRSKADKLYSPHLPFVHFDDQWMRVYRYAAYCGKESNVRLIQEDSIDQAFELAESLGIKAEPSGLGGLALFLQMKDEIPKDAKILIVSTGKAKYFD